MDVDDYEEVWQYGSSPKNPYLWEVDGVAVQCQDFVNMPDFNTIYLEDYPDVTEAYRNFLDAHYIKNYGWIFSVINEKAPKGYIKRRD